MLVIRISKFPRGIAGMMLASGFVTSSMTRLRTPRVSSARGFALVELMTVVIIITVLAAVAMPGIVRQLRNREARLAADYVAAIYRNARLRAMARGSAVLVRYTAGGAYQVHEAIWGAGNATGNAACNLLPTSSCTATNWTAGNAGNQVLETFDASLAGTMTVTMDTPATVGVASQDVCFTPLGRAFSALAGGILAPMLGAPRVLVEQASGIGLTRQVVIPPNGVARVSVNAL